MSIKNKHENKRSEDPVHCRDGVWYFWDETWSNEYGPFATAGAAQEAVNRYARLVLGY